MKRLITEKYAPFIDSITVNEEYIDKVISEYHKLKGVNKVDEKHK